MSALTDPTPPPAGRWCWGAGRDPHVADTARERGAAILCDLCYLRWQRETEAGR